MAFVDDLALVEVLIGMVAVLLAYTGGLCWWALRTNDPAFLRKTLKSSAIPVGGVGLTAMILGIWVEMTWPFNVTIPTGVNVLGGYNIFFGDAMVLFGLVTVAYAFAAYLGHHMHLVGVLAAVAGICVAFYGYVGYNLAPNLQFTKDPWDTFAMYGAFGLAGILAFPATVVTDYFLNAADKSKAIWAREVSNPALRLPLGVRASQPISSIETAEKTASGKYLGFRMPLLLQLVVLAFPIMMGLAAVAAFWYFGVTLPGHLGGGAAGAP